MKIFTIIFLSLLFSCSLPKKRTSEKSKKICENHVFSLNLNQLKNKIIEHELKRYRSDRVSNKQHPFYSYYYRYKNNNHSPIENTYLHGKYKRDYSLDDPLIDFAEIDHSEDSFTIVTNNKIYFGKKIELLKTKLKVLSFDNFIVKNQRIMIQTGFPMSANLIDLDQMIISSQRDYSHELNLIKEFEPNTYQKYL